MNQGFLVFYGISFVLVLVLNFRLLVHDWIHKIVWYKAHTKSYEKKQKHSNGNKSQFSKLLVTLLRCTGIQCPKSNNGNESQFSKLCNTNSQRAQPLLLSVEWVEWDWVRSLACSSQDLYLKMVLLVVRTFYFLILEVSRRRHLVDANWCVPVLGVAKSTDARKKCVRILSHFFSLNTGYRAGLVRWVSLLWLSVLNRNPTCQIPFKIFFYSK